MKKQLRTAMLSTACMLIVAVMSLTGVTYAWFSAGTTANVKNIDIAVVDASGGIQISKDGNTWGTTIDYAASGPFTFNPVSTAGDLNTADNTMKFFKATVDSSDFSKITSTAVESKNNLYFEEVLYLKNDTGSDLTITLKGTDIAANTTKSAYYASRIGFVIAGSKVLDTIEGQETVANIPVAETATKFIFEPYSMNHTERVNALYGIPQEDTVPQPYYGLNAASSTAFAWQGAGTNKALVQPVYEAEDITFDIDNGEYMKVIIYIWLEGQDVDCENSIASDEFSFNISFDSTPAA